MTDHGHHDPGGHELEAINTKLLFRLLISLSLVTFLAAVAVVQWFYSQRRELEGQYAAEGSYLLTDYKTKMGADLQGVDRVAANVVGNPALLQAPPPPSGWIHPDDLVGGTPAPSPAPAHEEPKPAEPTEQPADPAQPVDGDEADKPIDVPAEKPADEKPADKVPNDDLKPADKKPAEDGE